jgi:DNA modification methylase
MKIYNDDCFNIFPEIPDSSVDFVLCDPPFGVTSLEWDNVLNFEKLWESLNRIVREDGAIALFATQPFMTDLIVSNRANYRYEWIWMKNVPTGMASQSYAPMKYHEYILIFYRKKPYVFNKQMIAREGKGKDCYKYEHYCGDSNHVKMNKVKKFYDPSFVNPGNILLFNTVPNRKGKLHPTEKPVGLLEYFIKTYTNEGDTVLDFTMGSGSTGEACKNLNRNFIGIELDKKYFDKAEKRLYNNLLFYS